MVYVIHFDAPYHHARHYVGFSTGGPTGRGIIRRRLAAHADGRGARLMAAVTRAGIGWSVVRIFPDATRTDERRIKRQGGHKERICPICNPSVRGRGTRLRASYWRHPGRAEGWT
jgi:hypothetical protein